MNDKLVAYLKETRELLARAYTKWWSSRGTPDGVRYCSYGALHHIHSTHPEYNYMQQSPAIDLLTIVARRQHPEFEGQQSKRLENGGGNDVFDLNPLVYVNNHTDRETTLAVFDEAIASLEGVPVPAEMVKAKETVNA